MTPYLYILIAYGSFVAAAYGVWRSAAAPLKRSVEVVPALQEGTLAPYECAVMMGGRERTLTAIAAYLLCTGYLRLDRTGVLRVARALDSASPSCERRVWEAVRDSPPHGHSIAILEQCPSVRHELDLFEKRARHLGVLMTRARLRWIRGALSVLSAGIILALMLFFGIGGSVADSDLTQAQEMVLLLPYPGIMFLLAGLLCVEIFRLSRHPHRIYRAVARIAYEHELVPANPFDVSEHALRIAAAVYGLHLADPQLPSLELPAHTRWDLIGPTSFSAHVSEGGTSVEI